MSKINLFCLLLVLSLILLECASPKEIPASYLSNPRNIGTMTNGCWIFVNHDESNKGNDESGISGELIAVQKDTFYIQTKTDLVVIPAEGIKTATLYLFKDQRKTYLIMTGVGLLPNIIGMFIVEPGFILLGVPFAIVGITTALIEDTANRLIFPKKNKLDEFNRFSRFPLGIPVGVDLEGLTLKSN